MYMFQILDAFVTDTFLHHINRPRVTHVYCLPFSLPLPKPVHDDDDATFLNSLLCQRVAGKCLGIS